MTNTENLERFQCFNFETSFWKTKTFFKKLKHRFLYENNKIENAKCSYKTDRSEANVKAKRTESTKWIYHKKLSTTNLFFWKILFQF